MCSIAVTTVHVLQQKHFNYLNKNSTLRRSIVHFDYNRVIQRDGLNFILLYFLNYIRYLYDLHNIRKKQYNLSNPIARVFVYCTVVQQRQLRTKWLLCNTRIFACIRGEREMNSREFWAYLTQANPQNERRTRNTAINYLACVEAPFILQLSQSFSITLYFVPTPEYDVTVNCDSFVNKLYIRSPSTCWRK